MLEELYRDLRDELIRWCTTMTQDRSTAEDLVQEAFWKAINNEAMLQTMTPPQRRAWLYQVVKNLFIDRTRHAAYEAVMEELPATNVMKKWYTTGLEKAVSNFRQFLLVSGTILEARTTMTT